MGNLFTEYVRSHAFMMPLLIWSALVFMLLALTMTVMHSVAMVLEAWTKYCKYRDERRDRRGF